MKSFTQYLAEDMSDDERAQYVKRLQLKLTPDDLTDAQLQDFAKRSNVLNSTPAYYSAKADVEAMLPNHLQQVINHKRVNVFFKHHARQRLAGVWK